MLEFAIEDYCCCVWGGRLEVTNCDLTHERIYGKIGSLGRGCYDVCLRSNEKCVDYPIEELIPKVPPCPLCLEKAAPCFFQDVHRAYYQCGNCALIFVATEDHLSPQAEKAEYDLHENDPFDAGYRRFLDRLCSPLCERLSPGSEGLDFGSGPGPTLSTMLEEAGHRMTLFDPYYSPDSSVLAVKYDFITATEVIEHFHAPRVSLQRMFDCLKPGGWMGLMTKLSTGQNTFPDWHYKDDLSHVAFYSRRTLGWIGEHWNLEVEIIGKDVMLLRKAFSIVTPSNATRSSF